MEAWIEPRCRIAGGATAAGGEVWGIAVAVCNFCTEKHVDSALPCLPSYHGRMINPNKNRHNP